MQRTTERGARFVAIALGCVGVLAGCRRAPPPPGPPSDAFDATVDAPAQKGKPFPAPPDAALTPWKVWVNQEEPRQKKSPVWVHYDAKVNPMLDLAADGSWRCSLGAVHVVGRTNERAKVASWIASRRIRCSADGFRTHAETVARAEYAPDGALLALDPPAAVYLREVVNGQPRVTAVVLKQEGTPVPRAED